MPFLAALPPIMLKIIGFALGSFVLRLFTGLGIGIITYQGFEAFLEAFLGHLEPLFHELPAAMVNILAMAGVPEALSIVTSAMLSRAAIKSAAVFFGVKV